jgi:hypothetical protein
MEMVLVSNNAKQELIPSTTFSVWFRRLFDLAENKTIIVANLFSLDLEQGGEGWR